MTYSARPFAIWKDARTTHAKWQKNKLHGHGSEKGGHPFHAINCVAFPSRGRKHLSAFYDFPGDSSQT